MRAFYTCLVAGLVALPLLACKKGGERTPTDTDYASPSSPPPVQMVNTMPGCDDVPLCERECDAGAGDRCRRLGVTYEFGQGTPKDPKLATAWYQRSCDVGNATGCEAAGRMLEYHTEPKEPTRAAALYERACTLGWQGGCANFAIMLENGRGVPQDLAKAKKLYEGACTAGAGLACDRLRAIARDAQ